MRGQPTTPKAFPQRNDKWTVLDLKPIMVGSEIEMGVEFLAKHDASEKIIQVSLWLPLGIVRSSPLAPKSGRSDDFNTLKALLITKYGSPASDEAGIEQGRAVKRVLWTFPSTSIRLTLDQPSNAPSLGMIDIDYTPVDKTGTDAL